MRKERKKKEEDKSPSSGSIPDPESLDFAEYEDEDPGLDNLNGEDNEEPDDDNQPGMEEQKGEGRSTGTNPKNKKDANPHDY